MYFLAKIVYIVLFLQLACPEESNFVTCDLDLGDEVLKYLPSECRNLDEASTVLLQREAKSFGKFYDKLTNYEHSLGKDTEEEIFKDWTFRKDLYDSTELNLCQNNTETLQEYVDCVVEKRDEMVVMIDNKVAEQVAQTKRD